MSDGALARYFEVLNSDRWRLVGRALTPAALVAAVALWLTGPANDRLMAATGYAFAVAGLGLFLDPFQLPKDRRHSWIYGRLMPRERGPLWGYGTGLTLVVVGALTVAYAFGLLGGFR